MFKGIALGTAAALWVAGPASALTMTPTGGQREIFAEARVYDNSTSDFDNPDTLTADFSEEVDVAVSYEVPSLTIGGFSLDFIQVGSSARAVAGQHSTIGALDIFGRGHARAEVEVGFDDILRSSHDPQSEPSAEASAYSIIDVLFSIDETATFSLAGILDAGAGQETPLFQRLEHTESHQSAYVLLKDMDTFTDIYSEQVTSGVSVFDEQGVIGPGNYRLMVGAEAEASGDSDFLSNLARLGHDHGDGHASSGFQAQFTLEPIPEPVTASLSLFGLGALALQTSRRRRK